MFDTDDAGNAFQEGVFDHFSQCVFKSAAADAGSGHLDVHDAVFKFNEFDVAAVPLDIGTHDGEHRLDFFKDFFVVHILTRFTNRAFYWDYSADSLKYNRDS